MSSVNLVRFDQQDLPQLTIPNELFGRIISFIEESDLWKCTQVSKLFCKVVVQRSNFHKKKEIASYIEKLRINLIDHNEIELADSLESIEVVDFSYYSTLKSLKNFILATRTKIVRLLKESDEEILKLIERIPSPSFFENIFGIISVCKRIPIVDAIPDDIGREQAFGRVIKDFIRLEDFDHAIESAKNLRPCLQRECLIEVFDKLLEARDFDKAVILAEQISKKEGESYVLQAVCRALAENQQVEKAIEIAGGIQDDRGQASALRFICQALSEADQLEKAIDLSSNIREPCMRDLTCQEIVSALAKVKKFDQAVWMSTRIKGRFMRGIAIHSIAFAGLKVEDFDRLIQIASDIGDDDNREEVMSVISILLFLEDYEDQCFMIIQGILNDGIRERAQVKICAILAEHRETDRAIIIANSIVDEKRRGTAFLEICLAIRGFQGLDRSIEIAELVQDEKQTKRIIEKLSKVQKEVDEFM